MNTTKPTRRLFGADRLRLPALVGGLFVVGWSACFLDFDQAVPCDDDGQCDGERVCDQIIRRCVQDGTQLVPPGPLPPDATGVSDSELPSDAPGLSETTSGGGSGTPSVPCDPELEDCPDDPCDGVVENDACVCDTRYRECVGGQCPMGMAFIPRTGADDESDFSYCIDAFEASRADATEGDAGSSDSPPRSVPGVLPWSGVTAAEAATLCEAAGKRLCTLSEWRLACEGPETSLWPYGDLVERNHCNGLGFRVGTGMDVPEATIPTGSEPLCESGHGVFDLAGNVAEWVQEEHLAGGHYRTSPSQMMCSFIIRGPAEPDEDILPTLGFRCCREPYGR